MHNYTAAATVRSTLSQLHSVTEEEVPSVTEQELQLQVLENSMTYLTIPPIVVERGILVVNSNSTLEEAAKELGLTITSSAPSETTSRDTSSTRSTPTETMTRSGIDPVSSLMPPIRLWVGLDAEWKASFERWEGDPEAECKHPSGAAILQVQCTAARHSAAEDSSSSYFTVQCSEV
jgi:hypothetical protein